MLMHAVDMALVNNWIEFKWRISMQGETLPKKFNEKEKIYIYSAFFLTTTLVPKKITGLKGLTKKG